jgi:hypothetical protein
MDTMSDDVSRGQKYLRQIANQHGVEVHSDVKAATGAAIAVARDARARRHEYGELALCIALCIALCVALCVGVASSCLVIALCVGVAKRGSDKTHEVFLGGTCADSVWRKQVSIPMLEQADVSCYNPQLGPGEWSPACIPVEDAAKTGAVCQLFVITAETRGITSMIEAAELIASGKRVVLCMESQWVGPCVVDDPVRTAGAIVERLRRTKPNAVVVFGPQHDRNASAVLQLAGEMPGALVVDARLAEPSACDMILRCATASVVVIGEPNEHARAAIAYAQQHRSQVWTMR